MKHVYAALCGAAASVIGSYLTSFFGASMGWLNFSEGGWLVRVSLAPCIVAALALSMCGASGRNSRLIALLMAFFAVALAASVGAITVQSARIGFDRVNASGYLVWCWVYATFFLPLSYPLARLLQHIIQRLFNAAGNA